jgi:hypothetical protein
MISAVPSVSSVHVELDGRLPSTAGRTDETTKNDRQLDMTESRICSLRSRVFQHAMDAQHRKCNREHEVIPEAPQARSNAAGPLPSEPVGELPTTTTFCRRGKCWVRLDNSATLHLSVLDAHAVRAVLHFDFVFFHSFFIGFPSAIAY